MKVHYFPRGSLVSEILTEKNFLPPLDCFSGFTENQMIARVEVYFWAVYAAHPLMYLTFFANTTLSRLLWFYSANLKSGNVSSNRSLSR